MCPSHCLRLWTSVRLQHLHGWFQSWVPTSFFNAGGGRSPVEAWYSTALDLEESLSGALDFDVRIGVSWFLFLAVLGFLVGLGISTFSIMLLLGFGFNYLVVLIVGGFMMGRSHSVPFEHGVLCGSLSPTV